MAQQFNYPNSETELRATQDVLYREAKAAYDRGERPSFKGLIEVMSAKVTIVTAIHNIKANKGANTPGVDGVKIRNYLQSREEWVIHDIQSAFTHYVPKFVRRKYIDKPGKKEKRPLGIPTIRDRIVQECVRIVLEPIMEAQFYEHSYGFRPMRDTKMALERIVGMVHQNGWHWIVEGDISKCFDRIDHSILLKRLYHMGVKDRRLLQIIKQMLKAGIMDECEVNEEGTPQGGILSPLLANVYLDMLDEFVAKQWINKKVHTSYRDQSTKMTALRKRSDLIPGVLVRYADDFVIVTDSREHALFWKEQISQFLEKEMRLTLSMEKNTDYGYQEKVHWLSGLRIQSSPGKEQERIYSQNHTESRTAETQGGGNPQEHRQHSPECEQGHYCSAHASDQQSDPWTDQLLFLYDVGVRSGEKIQTVSPACGTQDAEEIQSQMDSCQRNLNTAECSQPI